MSYHTWTIDGYGICVDNIKTNKKGVLDLLELAPQVKKDFIENYEIGESTNENDFMAAVNDYENGYGYRGLGALLFDVICENETVIFTLCDNYDGYQYIIYEPRYPWYLDEREKDLTAEDINTIFRKYVGVLTDERIDIGMYSVENGG